ncbi:HCL649Cp [Eremothecium sinecaudum]|uniref:HCL649Cp n=1 Tax=Eremothecium sinecaudum TaxID=45286 RepID=A0A120K1L4_9SACH|nr:HCL649Cp [Eremothecium sinecaudum]AMD19502.1 HCL649Cp [Eremothecium sinecaudum]
MIAPATIKNVQSAIQTSKVFIASKTYCPFCTRAKRTIFEEKKVPKELVFCWELDTMGKEGEDIQASLLEITGQSSVPNIFINGNHIGGNSDLQALKESGELDTLLQEILEGST